ncbi:MAG: hypothetical protein ACYS0K_18115 [Planctomycetota bacterium]|jgi:hypothetical protein
MSRGGFGGEFLGVSSVRALNVREEEAVYDRLALSLTEATRTAAYVANRRALAFARVGGARTHVDVVERWTWTTFDRSRMAGSKRTHGGRSQAR